MMDLYIFKNKIKCVFDIKINLSIKKFRFLSILIFETSHNMKTRNNKIKLKMHKQKLIDDTFQVTEIDKGGKVFDKGK